MLRGVDHFITTALLSGELQPRTEIPRVVREKINRFLKPMYPCSWFEMATFENYDNTAHSELILVVIEHVGEHIYRYTTRFDREDLLTT